MKSICSTLALLAVVAAGVAVAAEPGNVLRFPTRQASFESKNTAAAADNDDAPPRLLPLSRDQNQIKLIEANSAEQPSANVANTVGGNRKRLNSKRAESEHIVERTNSESTSTELTVVDLDLDDAAPAPPESLPRVDFFSDRDYDDPPELILDTPEPIWEPDRGFGSPTASSCGGCGQCGCVCDDEPLRLLAPDRFDCWGIAVGGWLTQGFTWNPDSPADRFNGPVTFNDRSNEYQMNQMWGYLVREADTGGCGWAWGGRVDAVYGSDYRFTTAVGLEDKWNGGQRFYGLALPQMYFDAAYNNLTVSMGHFFTIIGHEVVPAPDNFFYSHAYTMQYGEPFTHTGVLAKYDVDSNVRLYSGIHRGWDQWEDVNDELGYLGGVTIISETTTLAVSLTYSPEGPGGLVDRTLYSIVATAELFAGFQYILQHDYGVDRGPMDAEWYSINNYWLYALNDCWSVGTRFEWFRDDDGTRVAGLGTPHGWTGSGFAGNFYETTVGVRYERNANLTFRSELRWDWFDGVSAAGRPYDDGAKDHQFVWGTSATLQF